jgi:flagellar hook-associated protein 2
MGISGNISFGGLGSGLDTNAIIQALLDVERVPISQLQAEKAGQQQKISLLGTLEGYVDSLREKAEGLATLGEFLSVEASNPNETVATITASTLAVEGSHTLSVNSVLATDRWAFDGVADPDVDLAAGASSVQFAHEGSLYTFNFADPTQTSLNEIASAINAGPNGGVSAQVLQTGTVGAPDAYQLVLTSDAGGASKRLSSISATGMALTIDPTPGINNNITLGSNAVAFIDGLRFERESNDFSDVIKGVSIQAQTEGAEFTFSVSPDKDAIKGKVQEFVDAYNDVLSFINTQNTYTEESGVGGDLFGDSTLRTVQNTVYNALFSQTAIQIANDPEGFGSLGLLGIGMDSDGKLSIDDAKMDAKMDEDLDQFADLFADTDGSLGADTGLADDLMNEIDRITKGYTDPVSSQFFEGIFDSRKSSLTDAIKRIDDNIEDKEYRLEKTEEQLVLRFTALETLMAQLNSQQAYLSSALQQTQGN